MKVLFALLLSAIVATAATEFDLRKGIDLTGRTNVTGSQLNQLVDAGLLSATNKGGIIRRSGQGGSYWPDVTSNPRYTNFLWADSYTTPAQLKTYVPIGDGYTNWITISAFTTLIPGSITAGYLAADSVNTTNITDSAVTQAKINAGAVGSNQIAAAAINNSKIADLTIQTAKLGYGVVTSTNIAAGQLLPTHFTTGSVTSNSIATPAIATTNLFDGSVASNKIATGAVNASSILSATITSNQIAAAGINYANIDTNSSYGMARAFALFDSTGTLLKGLGVNTAGMAGTSDYFFTLNSATSDTNRIIVCTPYAEGSALAARVVTNTATGRIAVRVTTSAGPVATASTVAVVVFTY